MGHPPRDVTSVHSRDSSSRSSGSGASGGDFPWNRSGLSPQKGTPGPPARRRVTPRFVGFISSGSSRSAVMRAPKRMRRVRCRSSWPRRSTIGALWRRRSESVGTPGRRRHRLQAATRLSRGMRVSEARSASAQPRPIARGALRARLHRRSRTPSSPRLIGPDDAASPLWRFGSPAMVYLSALEGNTTLEVSFPPTARRCASTTGRDSSVRAHRRSTAPATPRQRRKSSTSRTPSASDMRTDALLRWHDARAVPATHLLPVASQDVEGRASVARSAFGGRRIAHGVAGRPRSGP